MKPSKFTVLQVRKALLAAFEEMNQKLVQNTVTGKGNYTDVTQGEWEDSSFSFDDIIKLTEKHLNQ